MRYRILLILIAVITGLELLADFHPFPGIWWTHKEAMDYGGLAFIAVVILLFMRRQAYRFSIFSHSQRATASGEDAPSPPAARKLASRIAEISILPSSGASAARSA
jgi:hypothetical protein